MFLKSLKRDKKTNCFNDHLQKTRNVTEYL